MENWTKTDLSEIISLVASLRSQMEDLEARLARLQAAQEAPVPEPAPAPQPAPAPEQVLEPEPASVPVPEIDYLPDLELVPEPELTVFEAPEPVGGPEPVPEPEPVVEPEPVPEPELTVFEAPEPVGGPTAHRTEKEPAHKAVMDVMTEKEAWRKDMPGPAVKDVRSAISLNDRASFIRTLFRGDALLFSETMNKINSMSLFHEAEDHLKTEFPDWNMESDAVYRFMMAVRRKLRQ